LGESSRALAATATTPFVANQNATNLLRREVAAHTRIPLHRQALRIASANPIAADPWSDLTNDRLRPRDLDAGGFVHVNSDEGKP
jgi:hypothetical protein